MEHSPDTILKDGDTPAFGYSSPILDFGTPRTLKTANRLDMEYINTSNPNNVSLTVRDGRTIASPGTTNMNRGSANSVEAAVTWHRHTDERLGFVASGSGDVKIRAFELEYNDEGVERIR